MKALVWAFAGVLAVVWTSALALVAVAVEWAGQTLQRTGAAPVPTLSLPTELPSWVKVWVDPGEWAVVVQGAQQALGAVQGWLPGIAGATGLLEGLVWVVWGVGMLALLAAAAGAHWLLGRPR